MQLGQAPGTWPGVIGTDQCRLGSPRRGQWSKPRGDEVGITKCDLALGTDCDTALEDAYVQGLPQSILLKVYSQTSLPSGMDNWKAVVHNLDQLQRGYAELKQSIQPSQAPFPQINAPTTTQVPDTSMPKDIDQNKHRPETH